MGRGALSAWCPKPLEASVGAQPSSRRPARVHQQVEWTRAFRRPTASQSSSSVSLLSVGLCGWVKCFSLLSWGRGDIFKTTSSLWRTSPRMTGAPVTGRVSLLLTHPLWLISFCHFLCFLIYASWNHLVNKLSTPNSLSQGPLPGKLKQRHP